MLMLIFSCDWIPLKTQDIIWPLFTCSVLELSLVLLRRWKTSCRAWDGYTQIMFTASKLLLLWISGILPWEEGKIWAVHMVCVSIVAYILHLQKSLQYLFMCTQKSLRKDLVDEKSSWAQPLLQEQVGFVAADSLNVAYLSYQHWILVQLDLC